MQNSEGQPWNKGRAVGPKRQLSKDSISTLRYLLFQQGRTKELALFEVALSTMLRASDVLALKVCDFSIDPERSISGIGDIKDEISVLMKKTGKRARAIVSGRAKNAIWRLIKEEGLDSEDYLFCGRPAGDPFRKPYTLMTYHRYVKRWAGLLGLPKENFGTHSLRRTRAAIFYEETKDIRAVQLMLGHKNIANTQRYLGIEEDDALEKFKGVDV